MSTLNHAATRRLPGAMRAAAYRRWMAGELPQIAADGKPYYARCIGGRTFVLPANWSGYVARRLALAKGTN